MFLSFKKIGTSLSLSLLKKGRYLRVRRGRPVGREVNQARRQRRERDHHSWRRSARRQRRRVSVCERAREALGQHPHRVHLATPKKAMLRHTVNSSFLFSKTKNSSLPPSIPHTHKTRLLRSDARRPVAQKAEAATRPQSP